MPFGLPGLDLAGRDPGEAREFFEDEALRHGEEHSWKQEARGGTGPRPGPSPARAHRGGLYWGAPPAAWPDRVGPGPASRGPRRTIRRFARLSGPEPLLPRYILDERDTRTVYDLEKTLVRIGRGPHNDIAVMDIRASRDHCVVERVEGEQFLLRDLGSQNGTLLNGLLVERAGVSVGDEIRVGEARLWFGKARRPTPRRRRIWARPPRCSLWTRAGAASTGSCGSSRP